VRTRPFAWVLIAIASMLAGFADVHSREQNPASVFSFDSHTTLSQFVNVIRARSKTLEDSPARRQGFRSFVSAHNLPPVDWKKIAQKPRSIFRRDS
jgi:hypothetical protein